MQVIPPVRQRPRNRATGLRKSFFLDFSMKTDRPLTYYKWHWQDWRSNRTVQRMSYIERGLYRELLDECWVEGSVPDDIGLLADICGCPVDVMTSAWQTLSKCFEHHGNCYTNKKLDSMRTERDAIRAARSIAGSKGGISKSLKEKETVAIATRLPPVGGVCHIEEKRREENNTPLTPQGGNPAGKPKRAKREETTLTDWLTALPEDQEPILADDPLLIELDAAGVPAEYVELAWSVFVRDWGAKKAKDWPATFRNAIRKGWIRLWYFDQSTGECRLSSTGELARRSMSHG